MVKLNNGTDAIVMEVIGEKGKKIGELFSEDECTFTPPYVLHERAQL